MNILGIGPLELIFIIVIMILVLGPQQMVVTAKKAGALVRKVVKSPMWSTIMDTSREIREIPTKLVREAGLDEDINEIRSTAQSIKDLKNISVSTDPLQIRNTPKPVPGNSDESEKSLVGDQTKENSILENPIESQQAQSSPSANSDADSLDIIPENQTTNLEEPDHEGSK